MGPLAGITVVDLSERSLAAALAGMVFSDYGASVIRVESPGGDELRKLNASETWFRGQQSVTSGKGGLSDEQLERLCRSADVVIDTAQAWSGKSFQYRPPFADRQVYCLITAEPFSAAAVARGERPADAAYGELAEARYGFMYIQTGHREGPIYLGWPHAAFGAAWLTELGVLGSLYRRERHGKGDVITTSLTDGLAILNTQRWVGGGNPPFEPWPPYSRLDRMGNSVMIIALLECGDGRWLQIHSGARGASNRFFKLLGREDLVDPANDLNPNHPFKSREVADAFWAELPGIFKTKAAKEWMDLLQPLDVSAMPVLAGREPLQLEQARAQGLARRHGRITDFGLGARFERTPGTPGDGAPRAGEHNRSLGDRQRAERSTSGPVDSVGSVQGPLEGVTVLDLGSQIAGPFAMRLLADLGARVIKVDEVKSVGRNLAGSSIGINRGKESVAVNLKADDGREIIRELVKQADVLQHNLRFGVMERLGLDHETLQAINPRLVYCHSSGYGNHGPWASLPVWGPLIDATAGLLARTGGEGNPPMHYATHVDYGGALNSAPLVVAALLERERSGLGQYLEHPQLAGAMFAMSDLHLEDDTVVQSFALDATQSGHSPANALYRTLDGWILVACYSDREWNAFHMALGLPAPSERYEDIRKRGLRASDQEGGIGKALAELDTATATQRLSSAGVPNAEPSVVPIESLLGGELESLGVLIVYEHPLVGEMFEVGRTVRFMSAPQTHKRPPSDPGQHTRAILAQLGRSDAEVDRLIESGVIGAAAHATPLAKAQERQVALRVGGRLRSATCTTEVVIVRAPSSPVALACGGRLMRDAAEAVEPLVDPSPGFDSGTQLGKRYVHDLSGLEVLCSKAGRGSLSVDGQLLAVKGPKPLPSSD